MENGKIFPVEFKKSSAPNKRAIRHFSALNKLGLSVGKGAVLCLTDSTMPIKERVMAINVGNI